MTDLEEGLVSYLSAYAGLTAIISTRTYHIIIPQELALPCLTFQRISTATTHTHQTSGAAGDLAQARVQFDGWALTYAVAKSIIDQVRAALNGKTGEIGTAPNAYTIRASLVEDESPEYDPETEYYRCRSDYLIWYQEV